MLFQITYEQNGLYQGAVVDATSADIAHKFFRTQYPDVRICSTVEAKPVMSVPHDWHLTRGPLYGTLFTDEPLFSAKTVNRLHQLGLKNLGELISVSAQDLHRIKSLAPDVQSEISAVFKKYDLEFDAAAELRNQSSLPKRKAALSEKDFYAAELRAEGLKFSDIPGGRESVFRAIERIMEFGYEGIVPEGVAPKYSAETLCRKVCSLEREPLRFVFNPDFVCGFKKESGPLTLESDIRNLDLSYGLFTNINRHFGCHRCPIHTPIQIKHLLAFTEEDLLSQYHTRSIRFVGKDGVEELKSELAEHGMKLGQVMKKEVPEMVALSMSNDLNRRINRHFESVPSIVSQEKPQTAGPMALDAIIAGAKKRTTPPGGGSPGGMDGPGGR